MRPGVVWVGDKCQGQGELTGEVAVQADGDIVKSHGGSGSLPPPRNNLQPEPVGVKRSVCEKRHGSVTWQDSASGRCVRCLAHSGPSCEPPLITEQL